MTRRTFIILIGLLGATVLVVGAVLWFWPRGPLAGDWRHDFGDVLVPRGGITLQHTFSLRNRTDHDVTIRKISPSWVVTWIGS